MLVLNRKKNQSIVIGNHIEVKVLKIGPNFVELGINAPQSYSIFRQEIHQEIQKENLQAVSSLNAESLSRLLAISQTLGQTAGPKPPDSDSPTQDSNPDTEE